MNYFLARVQVVFTAKLSRSASKTQRYLKPYNSFKLCVMFGFAIYRARKSLRTLQNTCKVRINVVLVQSI